jgi:site-specific DNA-methyltransferase (adenine-specific)
MNQLNGTLVHAPATTANGEHQSLQTLSEAKRLLAATTDIQEVKGIVDKVTAMRIYAQQAKMGLEAVNHAGRIKVCAEIRGGELAAQIKRGTGPGRGKKADQAGPSFSAAMKEAGIPLTTAKRWQQEASVPEADVEKYFAHCDKAGEEITSAGVRELAREKANQDRREQRDAAAKTYAATVTTEDDQSIFIGDSMGILWDKLDDGSVDMFFTDPPYGKLGPEVYERLSALAVAKLKPSGLCLAYAGKIYLNKLHAVMSQHLEYLWEFCLRHRDAPLAIWCRHIQERWKPILAYGRAPLKPAPVWLDDLIEGSGREKDLQDWQQSQGEAEYLIERLTNPGALVVDPFCGSGTSCAAAKAKGRRWLGVEIDPDRAAVARYRLANFKPDELPLFDDAPGIAPAVASEAIVVPDGPEAKQ